MRDEHIISLLDSDRFGILSEPDNLRVEGHIIHCDDCRHAYASARVAAVLLKQHSATIIDPSPFFSTRVLALVREQQNESVLFDLGNMWNAARGLILSTVSVVVLLAGLTFLAPQPGPNNQAALIQPFYSTEGVLFGDEVSRLGESPNDEQIMDAVLSPEEADAGSQK